MIRIKLNSKKDLGRDYYALVDDGDHELIKGFTWYAKVYAQRNIVYARANQKTDTGWKNIILHRLIMGVTDPKIIVDHQDGNGLNCQRSNLREASFSENNANVGPRSNGKSKYLGVSFHEHAKKFVAQISKDNKNKHIGYFKDEIEAAVAYDAKAKELHGKFAKLNFPQHDNRLL